MKVFLPIITVLPSHPQDTYLMMIKVGVGEITGKNGAVVINGRNGPKFVEQGLRKTSWYDGLRPTTAPLLPVATNW